MLQVSWTCSGLHPIFIYICINMQMLFTFWNPCVMFLLNFLPMFLSTIFSMEMSYVVSLTFAPLAMFLVELSSMVSLQFVWSTVPLLALQMVSPYPSSFSMPLDLFFHIPFSILNLKLLLPQLYFSS
jgi:hypothetical protein